MHRVIHSRLREFRVVQWDGPFPSVRRAWQAWAVPGVQAWDSPEHSPRSQALESDSAWVGVWAVAYSPAHSHSPNQSAFAWASPSLLRGNPPRRCNRDNTRGTDAGIQFCLQYCGRTHSCRHARRSSRAGAERGEWGGDCHPRSSETDSRSD